MSKEKLLAELTLHQAELYSFFILVPLSRDILPSGLLRGPDRPLTAAQLNYPSKGQVRREDRSVLTCLWIDRPILEVKLHFQASISKIQEDIIDSIDWKRYNSTLGRNHRVG